MKKMDSIGHVHKVQPYEALFPEEEGFRVEANSPNL
jgi:hypothetical protein